MGIRLLIRQHFYIETIPVFSVHCECHGTWDSRKYMNQTFIITKCWKNNYSFDLHDDVIKWKHFPRNWPFVRGIHRSPVNSTHIGQWRGALMFSLICARINGWVNTGEAGDLRRYRVHCDVIVMCTVFGNDAMKTLILRTLRNKYRYLTRTNWRHRALQILANTGSGNGLLPDGTKPLPEPILTYHP